MVVSGIHHKLSHYFNSPEFKFFLENNSEVVRKIGKSHNMRRQCIYEFYGVFTLWSNWQNHIVLLGISQDLI